MNKKALLTPLLLTPLLFLGAPHATAQSRMQNDAYTIELGNFNAVAGKSSGDEYSLGLTAGQLAIGLSSGPNYKVKSGFQYIHPLDRFSFSISSLFIDFGTLNPGEPITRTNTLTVTNRTAHGYQVTAFQNHPLRINTSGTDIPDTTCDAGTCTETTAAEWSSPLTYGFGYRCDNIVDTDCAPAFSTPTYYKQFSNQETGEDPEVVMTGTNVGENKQVQITYKANISNTQAAGIYQNVITYIATPTF